MTNRRIQITHDAIQLEPIPPGGQSSSRTEAWGDPISIKRDGYIRIASRNIGGIGIHAHNTKEEYLKEWIVNSNIDCIGLQELNVNLKQCNYRDRMSERMKCAAWEFYKIATSYNKHHVGKQKHLFGGTMIMTHGQLCHRVLTTGADERGLGRWAWIHIHGTKKASARIISVYRPCRTNSSTHNSTVYKQQVKYFKDNDIDTCPLEQFSIDLMALLQKWITAGDKIILLVDSNEDIRDGNFDRGLRQLGLHSGIRTRHGNSPPPTHQKGSAPIDDIYVTRNIMIDKAGYMPFGDGPGDHRCLYVDVNLQNLVGGDFHKIHRQQARRLISSNTKVCDRFNALFQCQLDRNHVCERIERLRRLSHLPFTATQAKEYEVLDKLQVDAFAYANKRCRKLRMGETHYSPKEIQIEGRRAHLCTLILRKRAGCLVSSKTINRIGKVCGIREPMKMTNSEAKTLRAESWKKYNDLKPNSRVIRDEWMARKIDDEQIEGEDEKVKLLQQMRNREELRDAHKKIKFARDKIHSAGTQQLTIDSEIDGTTRHIIDKEEIELELMRFNKAKYQGANDTPFMKSPLFELVGLKGDTAYADEILKGTALLPSELDQSTLDFLEALKIPEAVLLEGAISPDIELEEHTKFWKRARESTQSSMSGLHFGFYKATTKVPKLARAVLDFIRYPFNTGYSPKRFQHSLNVSLQKEPGNHYPGRQRTIHLLEANFAEGCRFIFSKRMMANAKSKHITPETQYARKGGKAIDGALQKVLMLDHFRMTRTAGIGFANDLMDCYDRVVHSSAALAMRRLGVNTTAIQCLLTTLQNMKNYLRTAYGDSDSYYCGDEGRPLQGGGQGNPAAAPMWTAISIVILTVLSKYPDGVQIWSAVSLTLISFTAILFVDDTDLFVSSQTPRESITSIAQRTQILVNRWTGALWASGGCLRPIKCWFYAVSFRWEGSDWKYEHKDEMNISIEVPDNKGIMHKVRQINYDTPKETLGVSLRVDGKNDGVFKHLYESTTAWASQMKSAFLYRFEASLALMTTISKTWAYPLQVTTFSWDECERIMMPAYDVILSKMGLNKKLPRVFRFAPTTLGGFGLPHIYILQGLAHLIAMLSHCGKNTQIGLMLVAQLELCNIEVGSGSHLFHLSYKEYSPLLTDCWMKSTWQFIDRYNIDFFGPYSKPALQRIHDEFLMERLITHFRTYFTPKEIRTINKCRIYLQVLTLADIYDSGGRNVCKHIREGHRLKERRSKYKWPYQVKPLKAEWRNWRKAIDIAWSRNIQLGDWHHNRHQKFKWFHSISTDRVYHQRRLDWQIYYKSISSRTTRERNHFIHLCDHVDDIPDDLTPVTISENNGKHIYIDGFSALLPHRVPMNDNNHIPWWISNHNRSNIEVTSLLKYMSVFIDKYDLKKILRHEKLVIASDGSYHPIHNIGTAAVIIETESGISIAKGYCKTHGAKCDVNAYRSELMGILMGVQFANELINVLDIDDGYIEYVCDNETAVDKCFHYEDYHPAKLQHVDIIWAVQSLLKNISWKTVGLHVYGHQTMEEIAINQHARLNDQAHHLANEFLTYCIQHPDEHAIPSIPSNHWKIQINGNPIVKDIDENIKCHIHDNDMINHILRRQEIVKEDLPLINFYAYGQARKSSTHKERLFSVKLDSQFLPVAKRMHMIDDSKKPNCPCCGKRDEDIMHMLYCQNPCVVEKRLESIDRLQLWMEKMHTDPEITRIITGTLRQGPNASFHDMVLIDTNDMIRAAALVQDRQSKIQFHKGRIAVHWSTAQKTYFDEVFGHTKRRQTRWAIQLVTQLNKFNMELWNTRNQVAAEAATIHAHAEERLRLERLVREEFDKGINGIRPIDQHIIENTSLDIILQLSNNEQQAWLNMVDTVRKCHTRAHKNSMSSMRAVFDRWVLRND